MKNLLQMNLCSSTAGLTENVKKHRLPVIIQYQTKGERKKIEIMKRIEAAGSKLKFHQLKEA